MVRYCTCASLIGLAMAILSCTQLPPQDHSSIDETSIYGDKVFQLRTQIGKAGMPVRLFIVNSSVPAESESYFYKPGPEFDNYGVSGKTLTLGGSSYPILLDVDIASWPSESIPSVEVNSGPGAFKRTKIKGVPNASILAYSYWTYYIELADMPAPVIASFKKSCARCVIVDKDNHCNIQIIYFGDKSEMDEIQQIRGGH